MSDDLKIKLGVIFGGRSGEHEVSLMSAQSVLDALDPDKYLITQIGITHEGSWLVGDNVLESLRFGKTQHLTPVVIIPDPNRQGLFAIRDANDGMLLEFLTEIDVYFPVLHGSFGEDGTLQGLFEMAEIAYIGAGVLGSSVGMDKGLFKDVMRANDIPVVESQVVLRKEIDRISDSLLDRVERVSPYPLFTKPANMGSSVGVTKCRNRADLYEGLIEATRYDRRVMVERGVDAREIEISVLGNEDPKSSVPGEIIPAADFYSYEAKYHDANSRLVIPAELPSETMEHMRAVAVKAYKAIDCAGMARVDFLLEKDTGLFYVNELNTIPGFTQISMYPKLWDASGLSYSQLIDQLVNFALARRSDRNQTERHYDR